MVAIDIAPGIVGHVQPFEQTTEPDPKPENQGLSRTENTTPAPVDSPKAAPYRKKARELEETARAEAEAYLESGTGQEPEEHQSRQRKLDAQIAIYHAIADLDGDTDWVKAAIGITVPTLEPETPTETGQPSPAETI